MRATQHPSNNLVLGAPNGWDQKEGECSALAVTKTEWMGKPSMISFWLPSKEELRLLNAGKPVMLWICSEAHPPVAITVES